MAEVARSSELVKCYRGIKNALMTQSGVSVTEVHIRILVPPSSFKKRGYSRGIKSDGIKGYSKRSNADPCAPGG